MKREETGLGADGIAPEVTGDYPRPNDLKAKLSKFDRRLRKHWQGSGWRTEAREHLNMFDGEQWPEAALEQFDFDGRQAIVVNKIAPMVRALSGSEISNRQEVRFAPRELGDVRVNELLTAAVDWNRDEVFAADEESHAFLDMLLVGYGATCTRMDYDDDPEGIAREDRIPPLELWVDDTARKKNFADKRVFRWDRPWDIDEAKAEFPELFEFDDAASDSDAGEGSGAASNNRPGDAYTSDDQRGAVGDDGEETIDAKEQVIIQQYEWIEKEAFYRVADPMTGEVFDLSAEQWREVEEQGFDTLDHVKMKRKTYWRAFRRGARIITERIAENEFSVHCMVARMKGVKGTPVGLVAAMVDPQRWFNKFLVQLDRILASNAKGGVMVNSSAVADPEEFEENYAKDSGVLWLEDGFDLDKAVRPKPTAAIPPGIERLLQFSGGVLPEVAGVSKETLGQADRDQPIGLEVQRKEAVFGLNADLFDALKRFRRTQGSLHLQLIVRYMSDGRLIKISGEGGKQHYAQLVPMVRDPETARFDVIVDSAPTGPNQRERTAATLLQLAPMIERLMKMGLPPDLVIEVLEYLPLPSSLVDKLRAHAAKGPDQAEAALKQLMQQIQVAGAKAKVGRDNAASARDQADAGLKNAQARGAQLDAMMKQRIAAYAAQPAAFAAPRPQGFAPRGGYMQ